MLLVPSRPVVSRRRVLAATATLALAGSGVLACGKPPPPPEVDELRAQVDRARADSLLASEAATRALPPQAKALTEVASERTAHARALTDELARILGPEVSQGTETTTAGSPPATTSGTAQAAAPATTRDVIAALRRSADSAADLAVGYSGYRAGLLGSISAACAAAYLVALAPAGPP